MRVQSVVESGWCCFGGRVELDSGVASGWQCAVQSHYAEGRGLEAFASQTVATQASMPSS